MTRLYDGFRWGRTLPTGACCPSLTPEDGRTICDDAPVELDVAATARRRAAHERVWRCRRCRCLLLVTAADIDSALAGVPRERCERATAGVLPGGVGGDVCGVEGWRIALAGAAPEEKLAVVRRIHDPSPQQEVGEITADDGSKIVVGTAP